MSWQGPWQCWWVQGFAASVTGPWYKDWGTCICHSPSPPSSPSSPLSAIENVLSGLARRQIKD